MRRQFWHSKAGQSLLLQWAASQQEGLFWGTRDKACLDLWDPCLLPVRQRELETLYVLIWAPLRDTQVIPGRMVNSKPAHLAQVFLCRFPGVTWWSFIL